MGSDKKLIKELKSKQSSAFLQVYEKYKNLVYYQAYLILNNKEDAEVILKEVVKAINENK